MTAKGWTKLALEHYKKSGEEMRSHGAHPLRDVHDPDNNTTLTFWATPSGLAITQVFRDTGDVVFLRNVPDAAASCANLEVE